MAVERAERPLFRVEKQRQRRRDRARGGGGDELAQPRGADQGLLFGEIVLAKGGRDMHGAPPWLAPFIPRRRPRKPPPGVARRKAVAGL